MYVCSELYDKKKRIRNKYEYMLGKVKIRYINDRNSNIELRVFQQDKLEIFITNNIRIVDGGSNVVSDFITDTTYSDSGSYTELLQLWIESYDTKLTIIGDKNKIDYLTNGIKNNNGMNSKINSNYNSPSKIDNSKVNNSGNRNSIFAAKRYRYTDIPKSGHTPNSKKKNNRNNAIININSCSSITKDNSLQSWLKSAKKPNKITITNNNNRMRGIPRDPLGLTCEQSRVLQACIDGQNVFITGGAGVGKTFLLNKIIVELKKWHSNGNRVFHTATTGMAACAIGGVTIHQFAGISGSSDISSNTDKVIKLALGKATVVQRLRECRVLIIDEVSMMSPSMLQCLDKLAKCARNSGCAMGGIQVIMSGDFFQLPPVEMHNKTNSNSSYNNNNSKSINSNSSLVELWSKEGNVHPNNNNDSDSSNNSNSNNSNSNNSNSNNSNSKNQMRFCFQTREWLSLFNNSNSNSNGKIFILEEVHRQRATPTKSNYNGNKEAESREFIKVLNSIRVGNYDSSCLSLLSKCVGRTLDVSDGIMPTQIFTHRKDAERLNAMKLSELKGVGQVFKASDSGRHEFLSMLSTHCRARDVVELKEGAQVMLLKNAADGLVNGAQGCIVRFAKDTKFPVVRFADGQERTIYNEVFTVTMGGIIVAQRWQIPLELSWGISVHKAQGMTVEKAQLHLRNVFEYGQAYVALSRVRSIDGLSLVNSIKKEQVQAHPEVVKYYQQLQYNSNNSNS